MTQSGDLFKESETDPPFCTSMGVERKRLPYIKSAGFGLVFFFLEQNSWSPESQITGISVSHTLPRGQEWYCSAKSCIRHPIPGVCVCEKEGKLAALYFK